MSNPTEKSGNVACSVTNLRARPDCSGNGLPNRNGPIRWSVATKELAMRV